MGSAVLVLTAGWSAGVALAVGQPLPLALAGLAAVGALAASAVTPAGPLRLTGLALAALLLGLVRGGLPLVTATDESGDPLQAVAGPVTIVGRAADDPQPRGSRAELVVEVDRVLTPAATSERLLLDGRRPRVLVRASAAPVRYGDRVEAHGRLARPRSRPGWPLAEILARRGIAWVFDTGVVRVVEPAGPSLVGLLGAARDALVANVRASLPEPHASLVGGIVFGARAGLPRELRADLSATGTSHLTAVSGFNVAIVAGATQLAAGRLLGGAPALGMAWVALWTYTLLVGAPPSALRAAAMATCALAAQAVGRLPDATVTLALAAAVLVGWDPGLAHDLGFQLSVAATAGLVLLAPRLERPFGWLPAPVRGPAVVALAAQLATLPLLLAVFQTLSVVTVPANVLAAPLVPPIMALGAALALLAPLPGLGELLAWAAWLVTSGLLAIVEGLAQLPGAVQVVGRPPGWAPLAWYGVLACWIASGSADARALGLRPGLLRGVAAAGAVAATASPLVAPWAAAQAGRTDISLLDADSAAALVRTPAGLTVAVLTEDDGVGVAAAVRDRLGAWQAEPDVVVGPGGVSERPGWDGAPARRSLAPGDRVPLSDGVSVVVVDVRPAEDGPVADLAIVLGELVVWLPGPGQPSERWRDVAPERVGVVRLPAGALTWARSAPARRWLLLVGGASAGRVRGLTDVPLLDQREHGAVELAHGPDGTEIRTDRCAGGRACRLTLAAPLTPVPLLRDGLAGAVSGARLQSGRAGGPSGAAPAR